MQPYLDNNSTPNSISSYYCCQSRGHFWHFVWEFVSLRMLNTWSLNTCLGLRKVLGFMSSLLAASAPRCVTDRVYVAVLKAPALSRAINSDDLGITNLSPQNTFQPKKTFCLLEILRVFLRGNQFCIKILVQ